MAAIFSINWTDILFVCKLFPSNSTSLLVNNGYDSWADNIGNFLGCLKLLAEYDLYFAGHIEKYLSAGRSHAPYLSSTTCDDNL